MEVLIVFFLCFIKKYIYIKGTKATTTTTLDPSAFLDDRFYQEF